MNEKLRNRLIYWVLAIVPFMAVLSVSRFYDPFWFVGFLLLYVFIYRPALDTRRLLSLKAIEEKDAWKFFIPFTVDTTRYAKILWLG